MDWIHCNKCFVQLEPGVTLHLSSCGLMFCSKCLDNGTKQNTCLVCPVPCSVMKLVPDMDQEIQDYFTEPEEIIKKCCDVLQFQKKHRRQQTSPFNIPIISPRDNLSPNFVQTTPTYKRPAKSTPYS
ncbi:RING finger protein, partial [Operophtera brumata]